MFIIFVIKYHYMGNIFNNLPRNSLPMLVVVVLVLFNIKRTKKHTQKIITIPIPEIKYILGPRYKDLSNGEIGKLSLEDNSCLANEFSSSSAVLEEFTRSLLMIELELKS